MAKKRRLNTKEKLIYAPMSNLGELTYDEVRSPTLRLALMLTPNYASVCRLP